MILRSPVLFAIATLSLVIVVVLNLSSVWCLDSKKIHGNAENGHIKPRLRRAAGSMPTKPQLPAASCFLTIRQDKSQGGRKRQCSGHLIEVSIPVIDKGLEVATPAPRQFLVAAAHCFFRFDSKDEPEVPEEKNEYEVAGWFSPWWNSGGKSSPKDGPAKSVAKRGATPPKTRESGGPSSSTARRKRSIGSFVSKLFGLSPGMKPVTGPVTMKQVKEFAQVFEGNVYASCNVPNRAAVKAGMVRFMSNANNVMVFLPKEFNVNATSFDSRDIAMIPIGSKCAEAIGKRGWQFWQLSLTTTQLLPPGETTCHLAGWQMKSGAKTEAGYGLTEVAISSPQSCLKSFSEYNRVAPPICSYVSKPETDPPCAETSTVKESCRSFVTSLLLLCQDISQKGWQPIGIARTDKDSGFETILGHTSFHYLADFIQDVFMFSAQDASCDLPPAKS